MGTYTNTWKSNDSLRIYSQSWLPESPQALIALVHGFGEHCNRYEELVQFFLGKQVGVVAIDQRGHGQSEGPRGHTPQMDLLLDEIGRLIHFTQESHPSLPLFLYGHSMGGMLVLNYVLRKKPNLAGVIATGPLVTVEPPPSWALIALARFMKNIYPRYTQKVKVSPEALSRRPEVGKAYTEDPLVHNWASAMMGLGILEYSAFLERYRGEAPMPTLLMHGGEDRVTSPQGTEKLASALKGSVQCKIWEGAFHELHHEINAPEIMNYTWDWMQARLQDTP